MVVLWLWATQVDTIKARQSIAVYIGAAVATTTTSTTVAPTTTTLPDVVETTTTTTIAALPVSEEPTYQTQAIEPASTTVAPTVEHIAVTSAVRAMSTAKVVKPKVQAKAKPKLKKVKCSRKQVARRQKCRT